MEVEYAHLLTQYSLGVKPGDKVFIASSTLAEPLVKEVYREVLKAGGIPVVQFSFEGEGRILYQEGNQEQLEYVSPLKTHVFNEYDAYLYIRAPYNLSEDGAIDPEKRGWRSAAHRAINKVYNKRTAERSLARSLCQYPTNAAAQFAGMSLEEYRSFIFNACYLYEDDPMAAWLNVRHTQQKIIDFLNPKTTIRYRNAKTDISFSVEGRTWINSDGRTNMPSGEVYSSPVEDSVNGVIHFDFPSVFRGQAVSGISLEVQSGQVVKWHAEQGQQLLDEVMEIEGANYFGEVAIGTNYNIQRATKNILFDEKIGGTVHMALGQSYMQAGGKNQSAVHWDLIADMREGGEIYADDELFYQDGNFLI